MSSIRSLTATLALALAIPFAGAHASDGCAEAAAIKSASKETNITPATASKNPAGKHVTSPLGDADVATKQPVQTKAGLEPGQPQTSIKTTDKKTAGLKAFQKHKAALPGSCC